MAVLIIFRMEKVKEDVTSFKNLLKDRHYSVAMVGFLLQKISNPDISTFQEINDIVQNGTSLIIEHFISNPRDLQLVEQKNPLCIEAMRDYLSRLSRKVVDGCGNDLPLYIHSLKQELSAQLEKIPKCTQKVAECGFKLARDNNYSKIMVYNYSKSIKSMLSKLKKVRGNNLQVFTCESSFMGKGKQMFQELAFENIKCTFIADAEITYYINEVDCVLTGAEVILGDGSILNRTGTFMLALCAEQARKPLICLAESYKYINRVFLTQRDIPNHKQEDPVRKEPIIISDITYNKYIRMFCTDIGCLNPSSISFRVTHMFS